MTDTIQQKLNDLDELEMRREVLRIDYEEKRKAILAAVQADLDALDAEYQPLKDTVSANITALEGDIKADVIAHGETVKGAHVMAVYVNGRVSWDTKKLDGMMSLIPQLADARKQGEPSVTIRKAC